MPFYTQTPSSAVERERGCLIILPLASEGGNIGTSSSRFGEDRFDVLGSTVAYIYVQVITEINLFCLIMPLCMYIQCDMYIYLYLMYGG